MLLLRSSLVVLMHSKVLSRLPVAGTQTRSIKRWVAPTLRELRRRADKLGPQAPQPRSGFVEWNYRAELYAFGKRLHEEFQLPLLQIAFTQRSYIEEEQKRQRDLGVEESDICMTDNAALAERGQHLAHQYVEAYLQYSLPKVPAEGRQVFADYLLSTEMLAHIGAHLGITDLILAAEYPPTDKSLAQSLLAVIGTLEQSSGMERAFHFVRDFVCTQMNQRDLLELWQIADPEALLRRVCQERKLAEPEPRLLGDCGKNTVLAACHVGVYLDKQLIGKGFGEDLSTAMKAAALDALQQLFGITDNMRPFNFQVQVEPKSVKLN